jgi:predicted dehydrogenase
MNKVRLGYIGCGLVVKDHHWPALSQLSDKFEVLGVVSRNVENAKLFSNICGAKYYYDDYKCLLDNSEVEAVVISYPFELNYEITKAALKAGKHVFIEKPLAPTLKEAREMVEWADSSCLVVMLMENYRYREAFTQAGRYMQEGIIGKPHTMLFSVIENFERNQKWLKNSNWRFNCVGGIMLDKEIHFCAVMRTILGEIKSAIGFAGLSRKDIGVLDYVTLHMLFENGAIGTMYDVASVEGYSRNDIVITGSEGTMIIDSRGEPETEFEVLTINQTSGKKIRKYFKDDKFYSFIREFDDFYNV